MRNSFYFKGGVTNAGNGASVKFLLFLLNGGKEVSLHEGKKYAFVENPPIASLADWSPNDFVTDCAVVKLFLLEQKFGSQKFMQSFYMALGNKLDRQEVTIHPRDTTARAMGYLFKAEAKFLKKSEALALLDSTGVAYQVLLRQQTPPISMLKEIIQIDRHEPAQEIRAASHGSVRKLRIN